MHPAGSGKAHRVLGQTEVAEPMAMMAKEPTAGKPSG